MSTCCSKHVEAWNKYIEKSASSWSFNKNYVEMHGQQKNYVTRYSDWTIDWHLTSCGYSIPDSGKLLLNELAVVGRSHELCGMQRSKG
jgi:hypothetical protein